MNLSRVVQLNTPPAKLADFPDYAAEEAKYRKVKDDRRALQTQITAAERGVSDVVGISDDQDLTERAKAILAGREGESRKRTLAQMRENIGALRDREAVLLRAEALQKQALGEARHVCSLALAEKLGPKHKDAVRKIIVAAQSFQSALREETGVREALSATGADQILPEFAFDVRTLGEFLARASAYVKAK